MSLTTRWVNHFRLPTKLLSPRLELALVFIGMFSLALIMGLHHPPFMVPAGWQWPPFESIQERFVHAFALSLWVVPWGIATFCTCDVIRVVVRAISP
ncbi:MAG: hypothetical protein FJ308_08840 [Planctomycetes bacterium]|nr:hypothetical protein [Planctomycetota bacterium]